MDNATAIVKGSESNLFVDLPINCDMIDNIILGPTFSESDEQLLLNLPDKKINFADLATSPLIGTNIIYMR